MNNLYKRVKSYISDCRMILPGDSVICGVSGGADSLCLFYVLLDFSREAGFYLETVHVQHGLRESAEGDLQFVKKICEREQVPFRSVRTDAAAMAEEWGTGVEEAGRRIRYEAFEQISAGLEKERGGTCRIAVAHHREDQAETVLFHLCRGTDLRGARGMLPVSGKLIRPLLRESRREIESFLTERGLRWREDETNQDTSYSRNFLRKEIFPRLTEGINPAAADRIGRFASVCAETERFLEAETKKALARCLLKNGLAPARSDPASPETALSLEAWRREDPVLQGRILYDCLAVCAGGRKDLSSIHIDAMRGLCEGDKDGSLSMPGKITFLRSEGTLFFLRKPDIADREQDIAGHKEHGGEAPGCERCTGMENPVWQYPFCADEYICRVRDFDGDMSAIPRNEYTKWFDYDKIGTFPVFRTRQNGDRMTLSAGNAGRTVIRKKLARIMLDAKIPVRLRGAIVLPFCGEEALWIPGLRMGDRFRVSPDTGRILEIRWYPGSAAPREQPGS